MHLIKYPVLHVHVIEWIDNTINEKEEAQVKVVLSAER